VHDLIERLGNAGKLESPRETGKWTPQEIVAHLADVEAVQTVRVMAMLALGRPVMLGFNADDWVAAGRYASRDAHQSVRTFTALRERKLQLWRTLTPAQLARLGAHPTRGEFTVEAWLGFVARHDAKHLAQLNQSLS
jgi:hypothetical protein